MKVKTLAHASQDAEVFVRRAAEGLHWQGAEFILPLAGVEQLVQTIDATSDVDGVVRVGDPASPDPALLATLYGARSALLVSGVAEIHTDWVLVRDAKSGGEVRSVVVREQAYLDLKENLSGDGISCEVVPNQTTAKGMLAQAGPANAALVDVDELHHFPDLPVTSYIKQMPTNVGLISRDITPDPEHYWLALTPEVERPGTLARALEVIAHFNVDLSFLHSDQVSRFQHTFYLGYMQPDSHLTERVEESLVADGFKVTLLGAF